MPRHTALKSHLRVLRRSTRLIARSLGRLGSEVRRLEREVMRRSKDAAGRPKRTLRLTAKRRATLKLQGAYMGYMRQLKPAQKARVKAVKEKRGFVAAIALARRTLSK